MNYFKRILNRYVVLLMRHLDIRDAHGKYGGMELDNALDALEKDIENMIVKAIREHEEIYHANR